MLNLSWMKWDHVRQVGHGISTALLNNHVNRLWSLYCRMGPNKKISVSGNRSEKFREGRHTYFFNYFFFLKKYNFVHFKRHFVRLSVAGSTVAQLEVFFNSDYL